MAAAGDDLAAELDRLVSMPIVQLRALWRAKYKSEPPKAFGPDLLRRSIAYKIQEDRFGGLPSSTRRLLNQLVAQQAKNPAGKVTPPRRVKAGAVLVREWKGKSHRVMVLQDGFAYGGRSYPTLSEIAREITGTRWNGPRFFGLRKDAVQKTKEAEAPASAERHSGQRAPRKATPRGSSRHMPKTDRAQRREGTHGS